MAKFDLMAVFADIKAYRKTYMLTAVASFGGMVRDIRIVGRTVKNLQFGSCSDGTLALLVEC
jgi:hypothetical protein